MRYDGSMTSLRRAARWCLPALALAAAPAVRAQGEPAADAPFPLTLDVGEVKPLCPTGTVQCPPRAILCDDPKVAVGADSPEGGALRGVGPGTTTCSAAGGSPLGARRVYRVTVVAPGDGGARGGGR
ncbi:conserved hypothetical protein [Anaeromyxobacter dehalogenans 2CP-1]|uniref:Secreted protein n=2 Tax=Anaeromyxobacter dehalogenans TaxID=161493 RepID=B8JBX9_ANAD2|nr:conserved hypothetical protein [Anaeromyxobacter dehalogenans 2CP-1]